MHTTRISRAWALLLGMFVIFTGAFASPVMAQEDAGPSESVDVVFTPDPSVDADAYSLWVWVPGGNGVAMDFTGTDSDGNLTASIEPPSPSSTLNVIVRRTEGSNEWAWQTPDLTGIPVPSTVTITHDNPEDYVITAPGGGSDTEVHTEVEVTVHYVRYDDDYTGWNIWTWLPGEDGKSVPFEDVDGDHTATFTHSDPDGVNSVGLIVRKSEDGNEWAAKNTADDVVLTSFPNGQTEIWIVQGNPTIFYSPNNLPEEPVLGQCHDLHTDEFNAEYYYDGELGAIYSPEATTFRLWAPTAQTVEFVNYSTDEVTAMTAGERGTWEITLEGDQHLTEYRYRLSFEDGTITESVDPYARATTANSTRTVVVDAEALGNAGDRMPSFSGPQDAIIYEAHIRDLTIGTDNGIENKGKFLGLTESGTRTAEGNLSGLDYLESLGVTHVQFLPMYDFGSVDETGDLSYGAQYNWGYDPMNYNVPEGSYSSDPLDPTSRIVEMKDMIRAIHDRDMYVIMDVVYNHVYATNTSPLEKTVPGYYFRMDDYCNFYNGTGVGNETASEQLMMRKYIVDSVVYWVENYNIDGFRFDLMGIHDVETMNAVREAVNEIDPSIIILGEGWQMGNHPSGSTPSDYWHASEMGAIAHFNDDFRDVMKGNNFNATSPGFVSGDANPELASKLFTNLAGAQGVRDFDNPTQSVIYNEAHDNYTMFDKLIGTMPDESIENIALRHTLATSVQYVGNGVLFLHAGQEALRTKGMDHNSYRSPDSVNEFDYDRAVEFGAEVDFVRELNAFRNDPANSWMKMTSYADIDAAYEKLTAEAFKLSYRVADAYGDSDVYVLINADTATWTSADVPAGDYEILIGDGQVYETPQALTVEDGVDVSAHRLLVIRELVEETDPVEPVDPITAAVDARIDPIEQGEVQTFVVTGFEDGANVTLTVYSEPIELGTYTVENGEITVQWTVPENFELGQHRIDATSGDITVDDAFRVVAPDEAAPVDPVDPADPADPADPKPTDPKPVDGDLAKTGSNATTFGIIAALLASAGAILLAWRRRLA